MSATWARPHHEPSDAQASVLFLAFSKDEPDTSRPLSLPRYGAPSAAAAKAITVQGARRASDPAWFDKWRTGGMREVARLHLGDDAARLDEARFVHLIRFEAKDPSDLAYLQAAWAYAKWIVDCGASVVLDVPASRFRPAARVSALAADRKLAVAEEISIVLADGGETDRRHLLHTRGMAKFARPDVAMFVDRNDVKAQAPILGAAAEALAEGRALRTGERIKIGQRAFTALPYTPPAGKDARLYLGGMVLEEEDKDVPFWERHR